MSEAAGREWYIDAWSPFDGLAFASLRAEESLRSLASVFLRPPYFEPESMGSLATAKAALRGAFQDGFRDANGGEIAFANAGQVAEAVRGVYRAASQGDPPEGHPIDERPPPTDPPLDDADTSDEMLRSLEADLDSPWRDFIEQAMESPEKRNQDQFHEATQRIVDLADGGIVPRFFGAVAERFLSQSVELGRQSEEQFSSLARWLAAAERVGYRVSWEPDGYRVGDHYWARNDLVPQAEEAYYYMTSHANWDLFSSQDVEFAPAPPMPPNWIGHSSLPGIATVDQAALAVVTDRTLLPQIERPRGGAALLAKALIYATGRRHPGRWGPGPSDWRKVEARTRAARWIAESVPSGILEGHPIEREIALLQRAAIAVRHDAMASAAEEGRLLWQEQYRAGQVDQIAQKMAELRGGNDTWTSTSTA